MTPRVPGPAQRPHDAAAIDRPVQRVPDLGAVEPEDDDIDGFFRFVDGPDHGRDAVAWLNEQLHFVLGFFSVHSTEACPSGSSFSRALVSRSLFSSSGTHTS